MDPLILPSEDAIISNFLSWWYGKYYLGSSEEVLSSEIESTSFLIAVILLASVGAPESLLAW